jgi:hypothetical protein
MLQFGGKDSKRHFTVVMGGKEHGLYVTSTPSSAAKKAVTKLCASNKGKKVEFHIREITQGSKKKTYGPYEGYIEKLKEPIELKGRVIKYKPVAKLSGKTSSKKGGQRGGEDNIYIIVKCKSAGLGNSSIEANNICEELKEKIESKQYTKDWIESIEDLDDGKEFKINMFRGKQEANFKILYQTISEIIDELSYEIHIRTGRKTILKKVASFEVYKKSSESVNKYNTRQFKWIKSNNEDPALVSSNQGK